MAELQFVFANPVRKGTKKVASRRKIAKISRKGIAVPIMKRKRKKNPYYQKLAGGKSRGRTVAYPTTGEFKGLSNKIKGAESGINKAQKAVESAISIASKATAMAEVKGPAYKKSKAYRGAMKKLKSATNKRRAAQSKLTSAKKKLAEEKRLRRLAPSQANAWRRGGTGRSVKKVNEPKFGQGKPKKKGKKKVAKKKRAKKSSRRRKKVATKRRGRKKAAKKKTVRKTKRKYSTKRRKAASKRKTSKRRKTVAKRRRRKVGAKRKSTKSRAKYKIAKSRKRKGSPKAMYRLNRKSKTFRRANPSLQAMVRNWTGLTMADAGALAVGGALYGAVDGAMSRYAAPVYVQLVKVPVVGRSLPVLAAGVLALWAAKKFRIDALRMLGDGIVSASVVSMGVDAAQMVPGLSAMQGLGNATPQLGRTVSSYTNGDMAFGSPRPYNKPDFGGVDYTPAMSGVDFTLGGATPQMGLIPDGLGAQSPDFGLIPEGLA